MPKSSKFRALSSLASARLLAWSALLTCVGACTGDIQPPSMDEESDAGDMMDAAGMAPVDSGTQHTEDASVEAGPVEDPYQVCSSDGWCFERPSPIAHDLLTGVRVSPERAWFAGQLGTLLKFDGIGFAGVESGVETTLRAMFAFSASDVWAVGDGNTFLHFDGTAWSVVAPALPDAGADEADDLSAVWGASADDFWVVGLRGALWRVQSGMPEEQASPSGDSWRAIWGSAADNVIVVGDKGASLRYDGTQWTKSTLPTAGKHLYALDGRSETDVYAVGAAGTVLHYDGMLWQNVELTLPKVDLFSVQVQSATEIVVTGAGGATYRYDGTTWFQLTTGVEEALHTIVRDASGSFITAGAHGAVVGWDGEVRTTYSEGDRTNHLAMFDGQDGALWVLGDRTFKLSDNGYEASDDGTMRALYGGHATSASSGFACGTSGTIVQRKEGAFVPMESGTTNWLRAVWGASETSAWVVGDKGLVLGLLNGSSWQKTTSGVVVDLYSVWGTALDNAWTVGDNGTALHWDGTTWNTSETGSTAGLRSVWGSAENDVWASGTLGTILHWNGQAWSVSLTGDGYSLNAIWGKAANDVYAVGSRGTVLHYDGSEWTRQATPTDRTLFAVMAGPDGIVRAVGADGVVLTKR